MRMQLYITNNCNNNWLQRINLTGTALETAPMQSTPFVPASTNEWKQASVIIPPTWLTANFRFKFVYTSSAGNNVYIDDINLNVNTGISDLDEMSSTFQLFPNPATSIVTLGFKLTESKKLNIAILNLLGQTIYSSGKENYSDGEHTIKLSLRDISPGMYFINVADDNNDFKKPLVIISN